MKNQLVLKELSTAEIKERLDNEKMQYQKMLLTHAVSPIENPNKIKESRKNIARFLTELRRRELEGKN
ncbi:MAG: 50S ribosomal protein L29 [Bacteroidales bacterium]|nr:50S ribosomal protein L29 [Bacteroidales bacterium]MBQ9586861.1 50S ribosomal protein L29 [Bacteroidales bacterium]MBR0539294.1 50S ribosomal protein L29 [Bacteroidales bacterium]